MLEITVYFLHANLSCQASKHGLHYIQATLSSSSSTCSSSSTRCCPGLVRVLGVAGAGILSMSCSTRQEQGGRGGGASLDGGSRVEGEGEPTASLLHFGVRPTTSLLHNILLTEGSPGSLRAVEVDLPQQ